LLMVLWGVPMTLRTARRLYNLAEIVAAWAAIDVFLVSIIAAVMEIGALSQEVISSAFGPIESVVCELVTSLPPTVINAVLHAVGLGSLDLTNGCALFRVDAVLQRGCWLIVAAIFLVEIASHIIMELCEASISERMAMLSAYHRSRGISPRRSTRNLLTREQQQQGEEDDETGRHATTSTSTMPPRESVVMFTSPGSVSTATIEPLLRGGNNVVPTSRSLRRLLTAQELGSERFVGRFFDFFYGPFPRNLWPYLVWAGLMRRVEWEEIGRDLHEDLVQHSPSPAVVVIGAAGAGGGGGRGASSAVVVVGAGAGGLNNASAATLVEQFQHYGSQQQHNQHDDGGSAGGDSWVADSPHVR
jgi:hypothetical protein